MRPIPILVMAVVLFGLYQTLYVPQAGRLQVARTEVGALREQLAQYSRPFEIEQRLQAERREIARRIGRLASLSASQADQGFLRDVHRLAGDHHLRVLSITSKGDAVPLSAVTPAPASTESIFGSPAPGATPMAPSGSSSAGSLTVALPSIVVGVRLPRELVVEGAAPDMVAFIDSLGALGELVGVRTAAFARRNGLAMTIGVDLIVLDPQAVQRAVSV